MPPHCCGFEETVHQIYQPSNSRRCLVLVLGASQPAKSAAFGWNHRSSLPPAQVRAVLSPFPPRSKYIYGGRPWLLRVCETMQWLSVSFGRWEGAELLWLIPGQRAELGRPRLGQAKKRPDHFYTLYCLDLRLRDSCVENFVTY
ncbi:hypothetical protein AAHA92_17186 [Salvia divinorum]|uniref:Uncharacterized protein n=1 Tax=Salvia divinorum TaxID=28513 RepID=A0ABD1GXZ2_SALDI